MMAEIIKDLMSGDWTEEIVIFFLGAISITIIMQWDLSVAPAVTPGSEIVSGITGGLVGYLTRGNKGGA